MSFFLQNGMVPWGQLDFGNRKAPVMIYISIVVENNKNIFNFFTNPNTYSTVHVFNVRTYITHNKWLIVQQSLFPYTFIVMAFVHSKVSSMTWIQLALVDFKSSNLAI